MSESGGTEPTVLLVDDDPGIVEVYEAFLVDHYEVLTATSGAEGIERIDDRVDVALLDRRMPEMSGDELLGELRARGHRIPVAMLTAVTPDSDIIELPFDDYLEKPIGGDELRKQVAVLLNRGRFETKSREFYRLASKKATLEAEDSFTETSSESYDELVERLAELRDDIDDTLGEFFTEDPEATLETL
jgi:DNA-binding response OmpR family regulator